MMQTVHCRRKRGLKRVRIGSINPQTTQLINQKAHDPDRLRHQNQMLALNGAMGFIRSTRKLLEMLHQALHLHRLCGT